MDINWGINEANLKRKFDEYNEDNYEVVNEEKKYKRAKVVTMDDRRIYRNGNEVHFNTAINKDTIERLIKKINSVIKKNEDQYKDTDKTLKITYLVSSPGGSVDATLKFVDFIRLCKKKHNYVEFTSIATGGIASGATILSVIADRRLITQNSYAMIHQLSSGTSGKFNEIHSYTKHLLNAHNALIDIYHQGCKGKNTKEQIEKWLTNESWFTSKEYLQYGFVDEII